MLPVRSRTQSTSSTLFVTNPILLTTLGEKRFLEGVQARQQALDEAREASAISAAEQPRRRAR